MTAGFTESDAEEAALGWLESLGYAVRHGPEIAYNVDGGERTDPGYRDTILQNRLHRALTRLNPGLPAAAIADAYRKLLRVEAPNLLARNRALHRMLVDGVNVEYTRADGSIGGAQAKVIDFERSDQNNWMAVNQFTLIEGQESRRADIVIFVNGLPLAVVELKNPADENATVWDAVQQLENYQTFVPALFTCNAALIASDGIQARIGALGAGKEWFKPWRTISGREDAAQSIPELQVVLAGVFEPRRFLDLVRHFIVFEDFGGGALAKKIAGYHQFHAVNVAVEETLRAADIPLEAEETAGTYFARHSPGGEPGDKRVGVVWHTQGSGKSLTMAFYAGRLILHPAMENPTIVVITDRNDLDDQLFTTFARCRDLLRQEPVQAESRTDLRSKLQVASGRVVFTTIQKFMPEEKGDRHPVLSERRNIVVIADEAHRSQYDFIDGLARHLHDALPNASFIGFTGTPIEKTDANTRAVFGDYISIYDIQRAVIDGATVPIYYESRLAKLELKPSERPKIDTEFEELTEGGGSRAQGEAEDQMGAARSDRRLRKPYKDHRPRSRRTFRGTARGDGRQGDDRLHEPAHLRRSLPRADRPAPGLARRRRRDGRAQSGDDRLRRRSRRLAAPYPQQITARGAGKPVPRRSRPVPHRYRARYVADRLRRAEPAHDVCRQADARARADAGHRPRQPGVQRQAWGARRRLPRPRRRAEAGIGDLYRERRHWPNRDRPGRSGRGHAGEI
jgi:type I restriction enzyme R subunit